MSFSFFDFERLPDWNPAPYSMPVEPIYRSQPDHDWHAIVNDINNGVCSQDRQNRPQAYYHDRHSIADDFYNGVRSQDRQNRPQAYYHDQHVLADDFYNGVRSQDRQNRPQAYYHDRHVLADDFYNGVRSQDRQNRPQAYYHVSRHGVTAAPTLSATDHVNESQIKVPLQKSYHGPKSVIGASMANVPCVKLEVDGLLNRLNSILGTSYTQDTPGVSSLLEDCVSEGYDFGTAYACLRLKWRNGLTTIKDELSESQARDLKIRKNALVENRILDSHIPPRRVWDLYSNRVVPHWWLIEKRSLWAISHAWLDDVHLIGVQTPINGHEWPVPIPKDANLDLIRIELLNLGAEYVWLDVLCLRQRSNGPMEDMRMEEWKLDVPTIGWVYSGSEQSVVCYFSGLGLPLDFKASDLCSDRCWFRRAWTLQETSRHYTIGGIPYTSVIPNDYDDFRRNQVRGNVEQMLHKQMASLKIIRNAHKTVFDVLVYMQSRVSTNPADKVAGLAYLLYSESLPVYNGTQSVEDAWTALVGTMFEGYRGDLFFLYPKPGDGIDIWRPSWNQVVNDLLPLLDRDRRDEDVEWDEEKEVYRCSRAVRCIERGEIRGLSVGDPQERPRSGELEVKDASMTPHIFEIVAVHQHPIPDGSYTLLGGKRYWVIGRNLPDGRFRKVSVFTVAKKKERRRLKEFGGARELVQYLA